MRNITFHPTIVSKGLFNEEIPELKIIKIKAYE
jgi:hypothetical protein